jgi:hypothetical protein
LGWSFVRAGLEVCPNRVGASPGAGLEVHPNRVGGPPELGPVGAWVSGGGGRWLGR